MRERCKCCNQELPEEIELEGVDVMVKIGGKSFRCECSCNVFRNVKGDKSRYVCNSCGLMYLGE